MVKSSMFFFLLYFFLDFFIFALYICNVITEPAMTDMKHILPNTKHLTTKCELGIRLHYQNSNTL